MLDMFDNNNRQLSLSDVVQSSIEWHFSEKTGSEYWLEKRATLPFNPLQDVKSINDLDLFPDYSEELKSIPVKKLIPKGLLKQGGEYFVFESGGTTGHPQRIIELFYRKRALNWVLQEINKHDLSKEERGDWLHIGPTGPHIVGRSMGLLAQQICCLCFYIDFDPRWVKKCIKKNELDMIRAYVDHILKQAENVLETQDIGVIFATPPLLEKMVKKKNIMDLIHKKVHTIFWAGTSLDESTLEALENEFFENIRIIGIYGKTLMGIAPQRKRLPQDNYLCVFHSHYPFSIARIVDQYNTKNSVKPNEYGQVKLTLLTPDMLIPGHLERDMAILVPPTDEYPSHGLTGIKSMDSVMGKKVIDGVY